MTRATARRVVHWGAAASVAELEGTVPTMGRPRNGEGSPSHASTLTVLAPQKRPFDIGADVMRGCEEEPPGGPLQSAPSPRPSAKGAPFLIRT